MKHTPITQVTLKRLYDRDSRSEADTYHTGDTEETVRLTVGVKHTPITQVTLKRLYDRDSRSEAHAYHSGDTEETV